MNIAQAEPFIFVILLIWTLFWKGIGLWKAAKNDQRNWFIVFLVLHLNTLGILELIYLFRFSKKRLTLEEIQSWNPIKKPDETKKIRSKK